MFNCDPAVAADAVEGTAMEVAPVEPAALTVAPQAQAADLVERLKVIQDAMDTAMQEGVDYGVIPGTDKPTLFKPGSEKLCALFQLDIQLTARKTWGPGDHLTVETRATVFHAPTGARLGAGEGVCTTRERKYGKRLAKLKCPECGAEEVNRSKHPPRDNPGAEPGWYCWAKKGGCGANFAADDKRIVGQESGMVDNPDLPDQWNTVVKMAAKRARVDAVLSVTGASAIFTQDLDDEPDEPPPPPRQQAAPQQQKRQAPVENEAEKNTALKEIHALLAGSGPLTNKRIDANKGMAALGAGPVQRLRELKAAENERALDGLLSRINAAIDGNKGDD